MTEHDGKVCRLSTVITVLIVHVYRGEYIGMLITIQGGSSWTRAALFHELVYGVHSMQDSADHIYSSVSNAPPDDTVVVMAHNGPSGVGSKQYSICGKDWSTKGGETLTWHQCTFSLFA